MTNQKKEKYNFIKFLITACITVIALFCWLCFIQIKFDNLKRSFIVFFNAFSFLILLSVLFFRTYAIFKEKALIEKITLFFLIFSLIFGFLLCFFSKTGFLSNFNSVDDIRSYVSSCGNSAILTFILIQFSQVVVLPIPGVITTGAGALMFGPFLGGLYSFIGIFLGSIVAFLIGSLLGQPVVKWLIGEKNLKKCLGLLSGNRKFIIFSFFLFPFFPDDMLCFTLGVSGISFWLFLAVVFITRLITVFFSSFSLGNAFIPFDKWWGILIWIILFVAVTIFFFKFFKKYIMRENHCKNLDKTTLVTSDVKDKNG